MKIDPIADVDPNPPALRVEPASLEIEAGQIELMPLRALNRAKRLQEIAP